MSAFLDRWHEECGIVGVFGHPEAGTLVYLSLYALQHRGQEASGIVTSDGGDFHAHKGAGLVTKVFSEEQLKALRGHAAIGHNRYATTGAGSNANIQPLTARCAGGEISMAHNGNLVNADLLRRTLEATGAIFQSTTDSEVILHLIARSHEVGLIAQMTDALRQVRGAYSLVFLTSEGLIGVRDPSGVRPIALGRLASGSFVLASETCAFDLIGADYLRDVAPGEIVRINENGVTSFTPFPAAKPAQCVFEHVYFARPDSRVFTQNVHGIRKRLGQELARESPVEADIVIAVPDSGVTAALGFAEVAGIPFDTGLIRNHYIGRTFIEPQQSIRHFGVKVKLNAVREVIEGRRVVVVDDSIVRGTTSRKIVKMIRAAGAREIHMRISAPPIISPCFYGIDTPSRQELIAADHTQEEIRKQITADSLKYLSMAGMFRAVYNNPAGDNQHFCTACFSGDYPISLADEAVTPTATAQMALFEV